MSRHAVVLVGSVELGSLAASWAQEGLLGPVLWLNADAVPKVDGAVSWEEVTATALSPTPYDVRFQRELATGDPVGALTIAWMRTADEVAGEGMGALGAFARRVIHQGTGVRLFDVVQPTESSQVPNVAVVNGWEQVIVAPEDRPEVNGLDAGWVSRRSEVTLHVASAVVGRLGGAASPLPPATGPYIVSVWSRHVTGADHLKAEVARFFDHRLPTVSAADVEPHNYATFREEREHGDEVLTWMRTLGDDALRYQRAGQEVVDVSEAALPGEGRVGRSDIRAADSAGSRPPGSPQMVEEQAIKRIDETLRTESRSAGALLPAGVWRSVVLTLAATIDGGPLPVGSPGSWAHGHRLVVDPRIMWPDAELPEHEYSEEATRILPELDHCPPERIAASAVRSVVAELRDEDGTVPGVPFPASGVSPSRRNRKLVESSAAADLHLQVAQRDELGGLGLDEPGEPLSVTDRLLRDVLADAIRARLDAERWHQAAVASWPATTASNWGQWLLAALAAVLAVIGALWLLDPQSMNSIVGAVGVGPWPAEPPAVVSFVGAVGAGLGAVLSARRRSDDRVDWRFRRMLRELLAAHALGAFAGARRLDNALGVLSLWRQILLGVFPQTDRSFEVESPTYLSVPEALQRGPLDMYLHFHELQLGRKSAPPGWRGRAIRELAELALAKYDDVPGQADTGLQPLWADPGYREGPLHRVARDLPWEQLRVRWIDDATATAKADLAARLPTMVGGQDGQGLRTFLGELATPELPLIWSSLPGDGLGHQTFRYGSLEPADRTISLSPTLFAAAVLVVTRPLPSSNVRQVTARTADSASDVL